MLLYTHLVVLAMAPKTITVSGEEQGYLIGDNEEFKAMLDVYGVRFLVNQDGKRVLGFASLVDGGKYTLGPPQQQKHENQWYCVKGTIQRPKSSAGDRFKLVQLARGGYYPHNGNLEDAFQCLPHPDKVELRLISVSVVFLDENLDLLQAIPGYREEMEFEQIITYFGRDEHKKTPWETYQKNYKPISEK